MESYFCRVSWLISKRVRVKLAINCLSINNASALGVRTFFLTHLRQFPDFCHSNISKDLYLLLIVQERSLLKSEIDSILTNIKPCVKVRIKVVSGIERSLMRVLYEQFVLPLLTRGYDIIYSINNVNPIFLFGTKSIITIHDLLPFKNGARYGKLQQAYLRLLTKFSSIRATKIITVSNFTKSEILHYLKVSASKVFVFYNCLAVSHSESSNKSKQFLLIIGGLNADKRVDCTLNGFKKYIQRNPSSPLRLVIAGPDQGARHQLEYLAEQLGLTATVSFLGQISEDEKNNLLSSCVAIVMMGRSEGFGIPVLEAMRVGKPALVADAGALPEVIGHAGVVINTPEDSDQVAEGIHEIVESDIDWNTTCRDEYARFCTKDISLAFWSELIDQHSRNA